MPYMLSLLEGVPTDVFQYQLVSSLACISSDDFKLVGNIILPECFRGVIEATQFRLLIMTELALAPESPSIYLAHPSDCTQVSDCHITEQNPASCRWCGMEKLVGEEDCIPPSGDFILSYGDESSTIGISDLPPVCSACLSRFVTRGFPDCAMCIRCGGFKYIEDVQVATPTALDDTTLRFGPCVSYQPSTLSAPPSSASSVETQPAPPSPLLYSQYINDTSDEIYSHLGPMQTELSSLEPATFPLELPDINNYTMTLPPPAKRLKLTLPTVYSPPPMSNHVGQPPGLSRRAHALLMQEFPVGTPRVRNRTRTPPSSVSAEEPKKANGRALVIPGSGCIDPVLSGQQKKKQQQSQKNKGRPPRKNTSKPQPPPPPPPPPQQQQQQPEPRPFEYLESPNFTDAYTQYMLWYHSEDSSNSDSSSSMSNSSSSDDPEPLTFNGHPEQTTSNESYSALVRDYSFM